MAAANTSPAHTAGPWNTFDYGDPKYPWIIIEDKFGKHIAAIERTFAIDDPAKANARLIAQAPVLLEMVRSFQHACEERIAALKDVLWLTEQYGADADDIDDQIGHWSVLLDECKDAIDAASQ